MHRSSGIILQALPYQDDHHISTLFTEEQGIVRLFVRGNLRMRQRSVACVTPLTEGEWIYTEPRTGSLCRLRDVSIGNQHLELRQSFEMLQTGCWMAEIIASSQMADKPAPALYALLLAYLAHLPKCEELDALCVSFLLKLMRHEGLLALSPRCSSCGAEAAALADGASFCKKCAPSWSIAFEMEELAQCEQLLMMRNFSEMRSCSNELRSKVENVCERGDLNPHRISPTTTSR
jgi:DNA repair protein RecO (recombination protein O)